MQMVAFDSSFHCATYLNTDPTADLFFACFANLGIEQVQLSDLGQI